MIHSPLTMLMCSPTSDGAAAAILCSEEFVIAHNLQSQAIEIIGMAMAVYFLFIYLFILIFLKKRTSQINFFFSKKKKDRLSFSF